MKPPRLIALSDMEGQTAGLSDLRSLCEEACAGSVMIVVRDRGLSTLARFTLAQRLADVVKKYGQRLAVADRLDIATAVSAEGLHLSSHGISPPRLRGRVQWLSRSWHGYEKLDKSELASLNALLVSPAWQRRKGREPLGQDGLQAAISGIKKRCPSVLCYALGGVNSDTALCSLEVGADGVAVMSLLGDTRKRRALLGALDLER